MLEPPIDARPDSSASTTLPPIVHVDDARTWRGGQRQLLWLHEGLLAHDHDSRVVCRRGSALHERLDELRLPHYAMRLLGGHDLPNALRIGRWVRQHDAILHAHTSHAHDLALWAARLAGARHLVVSRRTAFAAGGNVFSRRKYRSARVGLHLAISRAAARSLEQAGVAPERIAIVPSGIDLTRFESLEPDWSWRRGLGLAPGELLVGSVAALTEEKDLATLIRAFARWRTAQGSGRLVVLGEGPQRAELERLVNSLAVADAVDLPGFTRDVLPHVAAMDIFVSSSRREGLGSSVLDAMACGRPIVATRSGGPEDLLEDGRHGMLVDVGDVDAMATAIAELHASAARRQTLGHAARERAREFDVHATVERTIAAYRWLLTGSGRGDSRPGS